MVSSDLEAKTSPALAVGGDFNLAVAGAVVVGGLLVLSYILYMVSRGM